MSVDRLLLGPPPPHDPLRWWIETCAGASRSAPAVTLELRWFGRGDPPAEVVALTDGVRVRSCVDRYANGGRDDVSVKLRGERRLTVKQRRCRLEVVEGLPPAERWSRRTATAPGRWAVEGSSWLTLRKRRARVLVDLAGAEPLAVQARRGSIARGGRIELVRLDAGGPPLWSVACETWGPGDRVGLARLLDWSGLDWGAVDRAASLSSGYPAALGQLVDPGS